MPTQLARLADLALSAARSRAEAAPWRLAFLFKASQELATSLEPATTMQALAELVVPELGDGREELAVGEALGPQAGLALENARLYEQQRAMIDRLALARGQLDAAHDERLRDDERKRIARELHDDVEQAFFAIGLMANNALDRRLDNGSA